jgi:hypothetical protein
LEPVNYFDGCVIFLVCRRGAFPFRFKFSILCHQNFPVLKIAQLLAQYLYQSKKMDLQGLGSFRLDPSVVIPVEGDKNPKPILEGISFDYNLRVEEDLELIDYIAKNTGKIKPLASADLDSFIMLGKQFLNIGKPFHLEGIGTLNKLKDGQFEFTPGNIVPVKMESNIERIPLSERKEDGDAYNYPRYDGGGEKRSAAGRKMIIGLLALLLVTAIAWLAYIYLIKGKSAASGDVQSADSVVTIKGDDTIKPVISNPTPDTIKTTDTVKASPAAPAPAGMISYKIFFDQRQGKAVALKRYNTLVNDFKLNVAMVTADSVNFRFYTLVTSFPADTIRKKDSVSRYFAKPVYIER